MENQALVVGRYELHSELASGGMAVVHFGRLRGDAGFSRAVAIKRLHRQYVGDPELTSLLLDEARVASRLQHPNVVAPQDLVTANGEIFLVMDYVHGLTLSALIREAKARGVLIPIPIVSRIVSDVLAGLHTAHEARDSQGRPLALVHRDVSPQNVIVGVDGLARVLDFGIAQAAFRSQTTREGQLRAKLAYAAPEHILDHPIDRRADVYSTAIVCWELLTLERLFKASNEGALLARVLEQPPQSVAEVRPDVPHALDALLGAALSKSADVRPSSAEQFAMALEQAAPPAPHRDVAAWVESLGAETLTRLGARRAAAEAGEVVASPVAGAPQPVHTRTLEKPELRTATPLTVAVAASPRPRPGRWTRPMLVAAVAFAAVGTIPMLLGRRASDIAAAALEAPPAIPEHAFSNPPVLPPAAEHRQAPDGLATSATGAERTNVSEAPAAPAADKQVAILSSEAPRRGVRASVGAEPNAVNAKRQGRSVPQHAASKPPIPPRADDCAELTEVDAQGIRRVKRQCLR